MINDLRRRCGITNFVTDWRYDSALNFYRRSYANNALPAFSRADSGKLPKGGDAYVIFYCSSLDFIKEERLRVIYHSGDSDAAIAIKSCSASLPSS
jgi:hypothetical protein